jgi:uncharacterized protein YecE (DUF72 family)
MRLHVGCAMWTHKAWRFQVTAHERLRSYAGWCNAVEGNTTFYATPPGRRWPRGRSRPIPPSGS